MELIEYYLEKCKDVNWYNKYYQCGKNGHGSVFKCFNTNYRDIRAFKYYFLNFKKYEGIPRIIWDKKSTTGQEVAKQYVVNMVESFLYLSKRDNKKQLVYELTSRGCDFEKMIKSDFSENEKNLLTYIYLMNASFNRTPRYLLKQGQRVMQYWTDAGLDEAQCIQLIEDFFRQELGTRDVAGIFNYDIVWYLSFYSDKDFLRLYNVSNIKEKDALKNLASTDYKMQKTNNVLTDKYRSANFTKPMLLNTLAIIYISQIVKECYFNDSSFEDFYNAIIGAYFKLYSVNKETVYKYILENEDIFRVIYKNAISKEDDFTENYIPDYKPKNREEIENLLFDKIDYTSQEGVEKLEIVRSVLKKLAKEKSKYLCALQDLNMCSYFTSKEEHQNFLEIHHLVPREFSYNFEDTIEVVENYIPLCPNCHRMIHKAEDRQRIQLIKFLFNRRKNDLENKNIKITINDLYDFYKINAENR